MLLFYYAIKPQPIYPVCMDMQMYIHRSKVWHHGDEPVNKYLRTSCETLKIMVRVLGVQERELLSDSGPSFYETKRLWKSRIDSRS